MRRTLFLVLLLVVTPVASCRPPASQSRSADPAPAAGDGPTLVLILVVDQLRADYLDRFSSLFEGGFARLLREGVHFTEAHHRHAITHTAPGHATLATGAHPRHHGVIANWWVEQGDRHMTAAVDDDHHSESPLRLQLPTLGDWLRRQAPLGKVFGISRKDRAAIFMAGPTANGAYWYDDETGEFVTSSYWGESESDWVREFNERRLADEYFGRSWEPLPIPERILAELGVQTIDMGPFRPGFPHVVGGPRLAPDEGFYYSLIDAPWLDHLLLQLARHAIEANDLGGDGSPDLLAVGLSALDSVGHDWGPDSREVLDHLLLLDRWLGEFLDWLDDTVGLDNVVIGLSADHGVAPMPEVRGSRDLPGTRAGVDEVLCLQNVGRVVADRLGVARVLIPGGYLEPSLPEATGRDRTELEGMVAREAEECPSVVRVWTRSELEPDLRESPSGADDPMRELWSNSYYPGRSPDFLIQYEEFFQPYAGIATTHFTPYDYDTAVPMLFRARGLEAGRDARPAATVDFAPTLAGLAGVRMPPELDGRNLFDGR